MGQAFVSSVILLGALAAATVGVLHFCQQPEHPTEAGSRSPVVASIAIVSTLPVLVLALLISRAAAVALR
jgi:hypothetical protein